jgi:transcriptional regulator with XRE-family HTH domain
MDLKTAMATNVRLARHAKKLTQEDLADRAGLSARYLGSIERAAVSASVTVLGACPSIRDHRFRREFDSEKAAIKSRTFHCGYRSEHR